MDKESLKTELGSGSHLIGRHDVQPVSVRHGSPVRVLPSLAGAGGMYTHATSPAALAPTAPPPAPSSATGLVAKTRWGGGRGQGRAAARVDAVAPSSPRSPELDRHAPAARDNMQRRPHAAARSLQQRRVGHPPCPPPRRERAGWAARCLSPPPVCTGREPQQRTRTAAQGGGRSTR